MVCNLDSYFMNLWQIINIDRICGIYNIEIMDRKLILFICFILLSSTCALEVRDIVTDNIQVTANSKTKLIWPLPTSI